MYSPFTDSSKIVIAKGQKVLLSKSVRLATVQVDGVLVIKPDENILIEAELLFVRQDGEMWG